MYITASDNMEEKEENSPCRGDFVCVTLYLAIREEMIERSYCSRLIFSISVVSPVQ